VIYIINLNYLNVNHISKKDKIDGLKRETSFTVVKN